MPAPEGRPPEQGHYTTGVEGSPAERSGGPGIRAGAAVARPEDDPSEDDSIGSDSPVLRGIFGPLRRLTGLLPA